MHWNTAEKVFRGSNPCRFLCPSGLRRRSAAVWLLGLCSNTARGIDVCAVCKDVWISQDNQNKETRTEKVQNREKEKDFQKNPRRVSYFSSQSPYGLWVHSFSSSVGTGVISMVSSGRSLNLTSHLHLVTWLRQKLHYTCTPLICLYGAGRQLCLLTFPLHAINACDELEVQLLSFFTPVVDRAEWSASHTLFCCTLNTVLED